MTCTVSSEALNSSETKPIDSDCGLLVLNKGFKLQFFDAVGWAAGRASGL